MSTLTEDIIGALRSNHDDLAGRVFGFDDTDLARISGAVEWTVAKVLSHLGSGAEIALTGLKAGISGEATPGPDYNQQVWDRWNAMAPAAQASGFVRANAALVDAFEGLDQSTKDALRVDLGFVPFPADIRVVSGLRLNEAALHSWDVRVAFDPMSTLGVLEAAALFDQCKGPLSFMLKFSAKPHMLNGIAGTVRVETIDSERVLGLSLGDSITVVEAPADSASALRLPTEAWSRLITGRLDASHTPDTVHLTGDLITLEQLRQVFPGY